MYRLTTRNNPGTKDFGSIAQTLLSNALSDAWDARIIFPQSSSGQSCIALQPSQTRSDTGQPDHRSVGGLQAEAKEPYQRPGAQSTKMTRWKRTVGTQFDRVQSNAEFTIELR